MQVFQSWADIVIMLVLAIAYIITYIAQRNVINSLKDTAKAHADLSTSQSTHIEAFKKMINLSELATFVDIKSEAIAADKTKSLQEQLQHNTLVKDIAVSEYMEAVVVLHGIIIRYWESSVDESREFLKKTMPNGWNTVIGCFQLIDSLIEKRKTQN